MISDPKMPLSHKERLLFLCISVHICIFVCMLATVCMCLLL